MKIFEEKKKINLLSFKLKVTRWKNLDFLFIQTNFITVDMDNVETVYN